MHQRCRQGTVLPYHTVDVRRVYEHLVEQCVTPVSDDGMRLPGQLANGLTVFEQTRHVVLLVDVQDGRMRRGAKTGGRDLGVGERIDEARLAYGRWAAEHHHEQRVSRRVQPFSTGLSEDRLQMGKVRLVAETT